MSPISLAVAGAIIDFGAVSTMFWVAGGMVVVAALVGVMSGVPGHMVDTEEGSSAGQA